MVVETTFWAQQHFGVTGGPYHPLPPAQLVGRIVTKSRSDIPKVKVWLLTVLLWDSHVPGLSDNRSTVQHV